MGRVRHASLEYASTGNEKGRIRDMSKEPSPLEAELFFQIRAAGLTEPLPQYKAIPGRKFVWDFAWVFHKLLVEVNGGTYVPNTGHTSGKGIERDAEKLNLATLAGFRQLIFTSKMIKNGEAISILERAINQNVGS